MKFGPNCAIPVTVIFRSEFRERGCVTAIFIGGKGVFILLGLWISQSVAGVVSLEK